MSRSPCPWPVLTIAILLRVLEGFKSCGFAVRSDQAVRPVYQHAAFRRDGGSPHIQFTDFGEGQRWVHLSDLSRSGLPFFFKQMRETHQHLDSGLAWRICFA